MKKIKNYTTKDWCISFCLLMLISLFGQYAYKDFFTKEDYLHGIASLTCVAVAICHYLRHLKKIEKKNE